MSNIVNICLTPTEEVREMLINYSRSLSSRLESQYVLGEDSVPHVTLAQIESESLNVDGLAAELKHSFNSRYSITLAGLCLISGGRDLWLEIPVLLSESLRSLQNKLLISTSVKNCKLHNGTYDNFRPHFTVGLTNKFSDNLSLGIDDLPKNLLRSKVMCRLSIGHSGENYTVPNLIVPDVSK